MATPEFYPLCRDQVCRAAFAQAAEKRGFDFRRDLAWRAQTLQDRRKVLETQKWHKDARLAAEAREAAAVLVAINADVDLELVISACFPRLQPLSRRRRRAYAAHLERLIAAAIAARATAELPSQTDSEDVGGEALLGRLCGACRGGCCTSGGEHAHLNVATLGRVMAAHPDLDPSAVCDLYLAHLAQRTVSDSCVNHGPKGCGLPRALRSDICNAFGCPAIRSLEERLNAGSPVREVLVLRRRRVFGKGAVHEGPTKIVDGVMLTETGARRFEAPKAGADTSDAV